MRKLFVIAAALLALVGCKSKSEPTAETVLVKFNVYGFEVTQEPIDGPSKAPAADEPVVPTNLVVFEGTETTPLYSGTSFEPEIKLTAGKHTLTFIATGQSGVTYNEGVWTANKNFNTYGAVVEIDTKDISGTQNIEVNRVNYECGWISDDVVPGDGYTADVTFTSYSTSLLAGLTAGETITKSFTNSTLTKGKTVRLYIASFCGSYNVAETIHTTITIYKNGVQFVKYEKDVEVLSNRRTFIKGKFFGDNSPMSVSYNAEWLTEKDETL